MSQKKGAINEVNTILTNAKAVGQPLEYVRNIFLGYRDDIPTLGTPSIMIFPKSGPEDPYAVPQRNRIRFSLMLYAFMEIHNVEKQLIGSGAEKGLMDLDDDIKNVLDGYPDLNGKVIKFRFVNTDYFFDAFPILESQITMEIEILANKGAR